MSQPQATDSFAELVAAQVAALRGYVERVGAQGGELDDAVQETVARALRYQTSFDRERDLGCWLRAIALRVVLDQRSQAARRPAALESGVVVAPESAHRRVDARDDVLALLQPLANVEREVLVRFHARGESIAEISRALGLKSGTVKSHLHRARRRLAGGERT